MADLLVEKNNSIATLTFNRPEARNALRQIIESEEEFASRNDAEELMAEL